MTHEPDQQTITDREAIAHSRERTRSTEIPPPGSDQPPKPFGSTTDTSQNTPVSAATEKTNTRISL